MLISSLNNSLYVNRQIGLSSLLQANQISKISSGSRVSQAFSSPSDLVMVQLLRADSMGTMQAIRNTQETSNVLSIAEGALGSIGQTLNQMKSLALHAMNGITSTDQVSADQAQINSALSSIQRIVGTSNYGGQNLLNGSQALS